MRNLTGGCVFFHEFFTNYLTCYCAVVYMVWFGRGSVWCGGVVWFGRGVVPFVRLVVVVVVGWYNIPS